MRTINIVQQEGWTGEIVPGTLGNLCLDVRDSEVPLCAYFASYRYLIETFFFFSTSCTTKFGTDISCNIPGPFHNCEVTRVWLPSTLRLFASLVITGNPTDHVCGYTGWVYSRLHRFSNTTYRN